MHCDLLIKNARVVKPVGIFRGHILVTQGKVVAIKASVTDVEAGEIVDVENCYVLPGVIDSHVHLGGYTSQDFGADLRSETAAAVSGGITTLMCFLKGEDSYLHLTKTRIEDVERNSLIDVAYHLIIMTEQQIEEIPLYVRELGVTSFKFFRAPAGDTVSTIQGVDDGLLYRAFHKISGEDGCVAIIHAENVEIIREVRRILREEGRQDAAAWSESRPSLCEEMSVSSGILLARHTKTPLCIAHLSGASGLKAISQAKAEGNPVFVETCPHYLFFTKDTPFQRGAYGNVNPPLRQASDRESLWNAIRRGYIDYIGSDHCPYTLESKGEDLWTARSGIPGISLLLPVLLSEGVNKGRIGLEDVARICAYNPARIFGLWPQKGMVEIGVDADLVVVDLERNREVRSEELHSHSDYSPYEGYKLKGWPIITIVAGRVVYRDGSSREDQRRGRYLWRTGKSRH